MVSLYWLEDAISGLLPTLWMILGVGLPWAYVVLSTKQWHSRATVVALALALGPAWISAWMLILGVIGAQLNQPLFTPEWSLSGTIIIAGIGFALAWHKRKSYKPANQPTTPLPFDEKLIIGLITIAIIIRWIHTAFWTFTAYDALWVYGYQSRLYFLEGFIPNSIDYYPQFLQLQYTFVQVLVGEINDHAARMVIPMLHLGSIFAAYLLGQRLLNRKAGIYLAALWSLHPYVGQWSVIGDLEIPVTFSFTMAAAFFLSAWMEKESRHLRRHDAIIAGLMLGIAMYTKPTAGAFIWGVVLLVVVDISRTRFKWRLWIKRFEVAFWTGIACIPLGAVWYLRNIALGHDAITFPPDVWLSLARRSGDHFNWIVLAIIVSFLSYGILRKMPMRHFMIGIVGIILLLAGVLPSNPLLSPDRFDPPTSYLTVVEIASLLLGCLVLSISLLPYVRKQIIHRPTHSIGVMGWALLLALPYFATWFYSYSYHYRLGFAVVPLLILPTAYLLSKWFTTERMQSWSSSLHWLYYGSIIALSLPGIVSVTVDVSWSNIWLVDESLDTDRRKYQAFNPSLMEVYFGIREYIETNPEEDLVIVAPGEQRLHFFFPQIPIINETVQTLEELEALGATHFVYGTHAQWQYERNDIVPTDTQIISALGRSDILEELKFHNDATFRYELYHYKGERFDIPDDADIINLFADEDIIFGDRIRLLGGQVLNVGQIYKKERINFVQIWQALGSISQNYDIMIEFANPDYLQNDYHWIREVGSGRHGYYQTSFWDINEYIKDRYSLIIPKESQILSGSDAYEFRIYIIDPMTNQFLPVYVDNEYVGNYYRLAGTFIFGQ